MNTPVDDQLSCPEARTAVQVRLDEPLPADAASALARHLAECQGCADYESDLGAMRAALRSMPLLGLPAEVLEDVRTATRRDENP